MEVVRGWRVNSLITVKPYNRKTLRTAPTPTIPQRRREVMRGWRVNLA